MVRAGLTSPARATEARQVTSGKGMIMDDELEEDRKDLDSHWMHPDPKDYAITELAKLASSLQATINEVAPGRLPGSINASLESTISYYKSFAS